MKGNDCLALSSLSSFIQPIQPIPPIQPFRLKFVNKPKSY